MKRTFIVLFAIITFAMFIACGGGGTVSDLPPATPQPSESVPAAAYMVRVGVHDDTDKRPLHSKAEIWFRGRGSWWIKTPTKFGSAVENLAEREPNVKDTIHIYPDGRDGKEITVSIMMTAEMIPKGSTRDSLTIEISDTEVTVYGLPLKAATGEYEKKFKR